MRRLVTVTVLLVVLLGVGSYQLMNARTVQLFGGLVHRVETSERVVALTFDDGPTDAVIEVLEILEAHDARATFFVTGHELDERPELGRRIVDAGHELGNHSWSHERLLLMSRSRIAAEIEGTDEVIRSVGHEGPIHVRPPYGKKLLGLPRYLADHERSTIMWDVEPESDPEVAADPERIVEHISSEVRPGSIVLLHVMYAGNAPSRVALPDVIVRLREAGYRFVTVDELVAGSRR